MSADLNENNRNNMPAWMNEDDISVPPGFESDEEIESAAAETSPKTAEAEPLKTQAAGSAAEQKTAAAADAEKPAEETAAKAEEKPAGPVSAAEKPAEKAVPQAKDDSLLGAPAAGDDDSDDFLFSKAAEKAEKAEKKVSLPGMDSLSGSEVPPGFGAAAPESKAAEPEAPKPDPELEKTRAELEQLEEIVNRLDFLSYLKPRLARIRQSGCDPHDLIGLYRMSSKVMLEQLIKQAEAVLRYKAEYDKRMRKFQEDVLFEQSSALITGVTKAGQADARAAAIRAARQAEAAQEAVSQPVKTSGSASEGKVDQSAVSAEVEAQLAVFRKQMEIKDNILMRAKQDAEEAEKRCDKMAKDVANVRARLEKDLKLKSQKAKEALFGRFLPVLDSFDGALKTEHTVQSVDSVFDGLKNIYRQLCDSCAAEGLEPIKTEKAAFDPNFHESMGYVDSADIPEDHVCEELRRGYLLDGKLLRAAMVRLASKPEEKAAALEEKAAAPEDKAGTPEEKAGAPEEK